MHLRFETFQPLQDEVDHLVVNLLDFRGFICDITETIFVVVVHSTWYELEWSENGILSVICISAVWRAWFPGIHIPIYESQPVNRDCKIPKDVHRGDVWQRGYSEVFPRREGLLTDLGRVVHGHQFGYDFRVFWVRWSREEVTPFRADLECPEPPILINTGLEEGCAVVSAITFPDSHASIKTTFESLIY